MAKPRSIIAKVRYSQILTLTLTFAVIDFGYSRDGEGQ